MGYLIPTDYNRLIQDVSVQQIISGNLTLKTAAEMTAVEEIKTYLRKKYDVNKEFTDTVVYSPTATYKANARVYLDAPAYVPASTYALKALVLQAGNVYECTTAITTPETFNAAHWQLLGAQFDIFYAIYPKPVFDLVNGKYKITPTADHVWWNDHTYSCLIPTFEIDHFTLLQYAKTTNIPFQNVFPDDIVSGTKYWSDLGAYATLSDKLLDTLYFAKGDNRNQQMILYLLDVVIYHLYSRIPPQTVPELRVMRYQVAISWLNKVAKTDDVVADLVKVQPPSGRRIRFGSRIKQDNFY